MKKSLLAVAALTAFAGAAQAQSSVTVYGIMDVGVMAQTNTGNLNSTSFPISSALAGTVTTGGSTVKPGTAIGGMGGGESMSRLGFKGSEDLGGGTKAVFLLEQGFNPMTGSLADTGMTNNFRQAGTTGTTAGISGDTSLQGQLFNRGAYAGLSNDKFGTLTVGRQQNLMLDNIAEYDPVVSQVISPLQYSGSYGGGGRTDNSRVNQAIKYKWESNGFNVNALYAPGGQAANFGAGATSAAQVGWSNNKFGIQAIVEHTTDAMNLAQGLGGNSTVGTYNALNSLENIVVDTTAYQLTAKYQATDALVFKAGYEREQIGTPSNFSSYSTYTNTNSVNLYNVAGQVNYAVNVAWLGLQYNVTPAIKVSAAYYYAGTPAAGSAAGSAPGALFSSYNGGNSGTAQYEALAIDYYLSKRTNLYALVGNTTLTGGQQYNYATTVGGPATTNMTGQQTYGLGMRHTF